MDRYISGWRFLIIRIDVAGPFVGVGGAQYHHDHQ